MTQSTRAYITSTIMAAFAAAIFTVTSPGSHAGDLQLGCTHCPRCQACCTLKAEKVDEERSCWEVEDEKICIPRVVFPWQKDCCNPARNNGAVVRTVKRLKAKTYECPVCEYTWEPRGVRKQSCRCEICCSSGAAVDCGAVGGISDAPQPLAPAVPQQQLTPTAQIQSAVVPEAQLQSTSPPRQQDSLAPVHAQPYHARPAYSHGG